MPRKVFVAGEILTAADVNTNLMDQAVMVFDDSAARGSAIPSPSEGMVTYLKDTDLLEQFDGSAFVAVSQPGILQIVRATDTTNRTTTSATFTDADISVTITPKSASSNIFLLWNAACSNNAGGRTMGADFQLTDSSNAAIAGAEQIPYFYDGNAIGSQTGNTSFSILGFVAAVTTASRTYKGRFLRSHGDGTPTLLNSENTGQLLAIEVAA